MPGHTQNSDIFRILENSEPEAYSEPWYIQNPDIFRTLVYSGFWYIQNPGIFKTLERFWKIVSV